MCKLLSQVVKNGIQPVASAKAVRQETIGWRRLLRRVLKEHRFRASFWSSAGSRSCATSKVEQLEGMEAYRFEFVGDSIHERLNCSTDLHKVVGVGTGCMSNICK